MAIIIDGNATAKALKNEVKAEVELLMTKGAKRPPHLAAILVGEDGASKAYVGSKVKDCELVGYKSTLIKFEDSVSESELLKAIQELNEDEGIDGFIVQLPLPKHIDQENIIQSIHPDKDVDGFHPMNFGKMALEMDAFHPATPAGIMELLERYSINTVGKMAVVIGRSRIVGRPMSILLGSKGNPGDATVILAHSKTKELEKYTRQADIIITALGNPGFLKADMISEGAVIIDVGITRVDDTSKKGYHLAGDVDFPSCAPIASYITPVPGGVGPMTRAMLLKNTLKAYKNNY